MPIDGVRVVRFAVCGNVIDYGANPDLSKRDIGDAINHALNADLPMDILDELRTAILRSNRILYLGDNAGEILYDRILIEEMPRDRVIFAVRGQAVLNDATMEDARAVGLTDVVRVIDNGSGFPGTVLQDCSAVFQDEFRQADLVISKGQGNFETLG